MRRAVRRAGTVVNCGAAPPAGPHQPTSAQSLPVVMAIAALSAKVCDLEANTIGVAEEGCPIVGRVLRIELCRRSFDARRAQWVRNGNDIGLGFNAKTEMVEPWSIRGCPAELRDGRRT